MYSIFTRQNLFFFFPLDFKIQRKISVSNDNNKYTQLVVYLQTQQGGEKKTMNIKYIFQFKSWLYFFLVLLKKY